jgi:hypothetical protein
VQKKRLDGHDYRLRSRKEAMGAVLLISAAPRPRLAVMICSQTWPENQPMTDADMADIKNR